MTKTIERSNFQNSTQNAERVKNFMKGNKLLPLCMFALTCHESSADS